MHWTHQTSTIRQQQQNKKKKLIKTSYKKFYPADPAGVVIGKRFPNVYLLNKVKMFYFSRFWSYFRGFFLTVGS